MHDHHRRVLWRVLFGSDRGFPDGESMTREQLIQKVWECLGITAGIELHQAKASAELIVDVVIIPLLDEVQQAAAQAIEATELECERYMAGGPDH